MNQKISEFMDNELFDEEADSLLDSLKSDSRCCRDWETYHLIRDVLRQPESISIKHTQSDLTDKVRKNLQNEPFIVANRRHTTRQKVRSFAFSAAASLLAVGMVVWMSLQINHDQPPQLAMQQNPSRPVTKQIQPKSNDYLMAHQEFSPSTMMNGGASYIHTVSYGSEEK